MQFLYKATNEALNDLFKAMHFTLKSAWIESRILFLTLLALGLLFPLVPYGVSGAMALLLNHITQAVQHRLLDVTIWWLIGISVALILV